MPSMAEEDADVSHHGFRQRKASVDTGPLKRHLDRLLRLEPEHDTSERPLQPYSSTLDEEQQRRGGVTSMDEDDVTRLAHMSSGDPKPPISAVPESPSSGRLKTPRISIDDVDARKEASMHEELTDKAALQRHISDEADLKPRPRGFSLWRRSKPRSEMGRDSDAVVNKTVEDVASTSPIKTTNQFEERSQSSGSRKNSDASVGGANIPQDRQAMSKRFFKGGRIGELVRDEYSLGKEFVWKTDVPRTSQDSHRRNASEIAGQDADDEPKRPGLAHTRSRSTNDIRPNPYQLPAFRPLDSRRNSKADSTHRTSDELSRQTSAKDGTDRRSRFNRLIPLYNDTSTDVSPNTSMANLNTTDSRDYGDSLSPHATHNSSRSASRIEAADRRLKAALGVPGGVGRAGLPITGLTTLKANQRSTSRLRGDDNMSDDATKAQRESSRVTIKEIYAVRSLLLSSGIKASSIADRAETLPARPSDFFIQAGLTAGVSLGPTFKCREHVVAARTLSNHLRSALSQLDGQVDRFRNETSMKLSNRMEELSRDVSSGLMPEVRTTGDNADQLVVRMTTTNTLAIKQVVDRVEALMRKRRRRLRSFRKAGFAVLEWVVVGLLWAIWFLVLLIRIAKGGVGLVVSAIKWLLFL